MARRGSHAALRQMTGMGTAIRGYVIAGIEKFHDNHGFP
jgi:hypothetical protein